MHACPRPLFLALSLAAIGAWLPGCTPGTAPRFRGEPELFDPDPDLPLTRILRVALDRKARLEVTLDDGRGSRTLYLLEEARTHEVPLLGVWAGDQVEVRVTASDDEGSVTSAPLRYTNGEVPKRFPLFEVLHAPDERAEPGITLFPVELVGEDDAFSYLVALDMEGRPIWVWRGPTAFGTVVRRPDGLLYALGDGNAWELDPAGAVLTQWGRWSQDSQGKFHRTARTSFNHELIPLKGSEQFAALSAVDVEVPKLPCDYAEPDVSCGPRTVEDSVVVLFERSGKILSEWSMVERLDSFRIGFGALDNAGDGAADWAHANAVIRRPEGGWLVSVRHQDCLVALDDDGEVEWILGDPAGWAPRFQPLLLEPVGEPFRWPYHAHGPSYADDGTLWVFDNGNFGYTPYTPFTGEEIRSRVAGFRIDAAAGTVTQVGSFDETATGRIYSRALGNSQVLPITGNTLGVYGMPTDQDGVPHKSLGFGSRAVRVVEWTRDGDLVADLRIRSDVDVEPTGWRSYRAWRLPTLYPDGVEVWEE